MHVKQYSFVPNERNIHWNNYKIKEMKNYVNVQVVFIYESRNNIVFTSFIIIFVESMGKQIYNS